MSRIFFKGFTRPSFTLAYIRKQSTEKFQNFFLRISFLKNVFSQKIDGSVFELRFQCQHLCTHVIWFTKIFNAPSSELKEGHITSFGLSVIVGSFPSANA